MAAETQDNSQDLNLDLADKRPAFDSLLTKHPRSQNSKNSFCEAYCYCQAASCMAVLARVPTERGLGRTGSLIWPRLPTLQQLARKPSCQAAMEKADFYACHVHRESVRALCLDAKHQQLYEENTYMKKIHIYIYKEYIYKEFPKQLLLFRH